MTDDENEIRSIIQMRDHFSGSTTPDREVLDELLLTPLSVAMARQDQDQMERLRSMARAQDLLLENTARLLRVDNPPPELLRLVKDYAKSNVLAHPTESARRTAFRAIYLLSIAAAVVKTNESITTLDDATLASQMHWLASQVSLPPDLRALASTAQDRITGQAHTRLADNA